MSAQTKTWKDLIADLQARGWTHSKLLKWLEAAGVDCSQATISDLARGTTVDPRFRLGEALRRLHASGDVPAATV